MRKDYRLEILSARFSKRRKEPTDGCFNRPMDGRTPTDGRTNGLMDKKDVMMRLKNGFDVESRMKKLDKNGINQVIEKKTQKNDLSKLT